MMTQPEYSSYYKFLVSIGLILIGAAILFPWLVLRESFDLLLKTSDISQLTPIARDIIALRQQAAFQLVKFVYWGSAITFMAGISLFLYGLIVWRRQQIEIFDLQEVYKTQKMGQEVRQATNAEIAEKALSELGLVNPNIRPATPTDNQPRNDNTPTLSYPSFLLAQYLQKKSMLVYTIKEVISEIQHQQAARFAIQESITIESHEYDLIIETRGYLKPKHYIIETRYLEHQISNEALREIIGHVIMNSLAYRENHSVPTPIPIITFIFFIVPDNRLADFATQQIELESELGDVQCYLRVISTRTLTSSDKKSEIRKLLSPEIEDILKQTKKRQEEQEQKNREKKETLSSRLPQLGKFLLWVAASIFVASLLWYISPVIWEHVHNHPVLSLFFFIGLLLLIITIYKSTKPIKGQLVFYDDNYRYFNNEIHTMNLRSWGLPISIKLPILRSVGIKRLRVNFHSRYSEIYLHIRREDGYDLALYLESGDMEPISEQFSVVYLDANSVKQRASKDRNYY